MQVTINGEKQDFDNNLSVAELVDVLALDIRQVAIEKNREIIARSRYKDAMLTEGDEIEIVEFIGGG